jgi:hypothetical protein
VIIDDCKKKNEKSKLLTRSFPNDMSYKLISHSDLLKTFGSSKDLKKNWDAFYQLYPSSGGYYSFSAVGFNPSRDRAIVEMRHSCGPLCGEGNVHFLEKQGGKWNEVSVEANVPHIIS